MPPSSNEEAFDSNPEEAITEVEVVSPFAPNISLDEVKVSVDTTKIADGHPMVDTRRPSVSTTVEQVSDGASIHSVATVHVTEASSLVRDRPEPGLDSSTTRSPPSSPPGTTELRGTASQRRARHSSAIEVRRISTAPHHPQILFPVSFIESAIRFLLELYLPSRPYAKPCSRGCSRRCSPCQSRL